MADKIKIKITKDDIESGIVEMPDGYKIEKYKTQQEINDGLLIHIENLEAENSPEPSDSELLAHAKLDHPYYLVLRDIEYLRTQLK